MDLILLDNISTHRSLVVRKYVESEGLNVAFILAYSPECAPIKKLFFAEKECYPEGKRRNIQLLHSKIN